MIWFEEESVELEGKEELSNRGDRLGLATTVVLVELFALEDVVALSLLLLFIKEVGVEELLLALSFVAFALEVVLLISFK